jgi:hypothetical protein
VLRESPPHIREVEIEARLHLCKDVESHSNCLIELVPFELLVSSHNDMLLQARITQDLISESLEVTHKVPKVLNLRTLCGITRAEDLIKKDFGHRGERVEDQRVNCWIIRDELNLINHVVPNELGATINDGLPTLKINSWLNNPNLRTLLWSILTERAQVVIEIKQDRPWELHALVCLS